VPSLEDLPDVAPAIDLAKRGVKRFRNGELISHEFGTCEGL
jgi:hypothetical protein